MNDNHVAFLDRNLMLIGKSDVSLCFTLIRSGQHQGASKKKSGLKDIFTIKDSEWSTIKSYLILVNVLQTQNEARLRPRLVVVFMFDQFKNFLYVSLGVDHSGPLDCCPLVTGPGLKDLLLCSKFFFAIFISGVVIIDKDL